LFVRGRVGATSRDGPSVACRESAATADDNALSGVPLHEYAHRGQNSRIVVLAAGRWPRRGAAHGRRTAPVDCLACTNKSARHAVQTFAEKAVEALYRGYHLLIIDLFPTGPRDPQEIHPVIWDQISDEPFALPPGEPLTLVAYNAGPRKIGYIEPTAVGRELIDMPLFLTPEVYINVPLEPTYQAAYRGVPRKWREVLEAPPRT
jgi:hypothetical protein